MGSPFRAGNFNQGDATGYQRPYRNYQNRNSRWNQNQTNRDRQWNSYNSNNFNNNTYNNRYNNNGYRSNGSGQLPIEPPTNTEGSGQSRMSKNSTNSNNSKGSFNSSGTADKNDSRTSVRGQLHNIPQSAANNPQDIYEQGKVIRHCPIC